MAPTVAATLRKALIQLERDRQQIEKQIASIRGAIALTGETGRRPAAARRSPARRVVKRRRMSLAARRAVSQRMKAYWAARKSASTRAKEKKG